MWAETFADSYFTPMLDGYGCRTCSVATDERLLDVLMGKNVTEECR
jgi:hypothetical protein